jgi:tetratricopeptide (TPR) repeat protein
VGERSAPDSAYRVPAAAEAGVVIRGAYSLDNGSLSLNAQIDDTVHDELVYAVPPVAGERNSLASAVAELGDRIVAAIAAHYDDLVPSPRLVPPPTLAAYKEFRAAIDLYRGLGLEARGWAAGSREQTLELVGHLERAERLDPRFLAPRFFLFDFYFYHLRDLAAADSMLALINQRRDVMTSYESLLADAWMAKFECDYLRGLRIIRRIHAIDPRNQFMRFWVGAAAQAANRPYEAIEVLNGLDAESWRVEMVGGPSFSHLCWSYHHVGAHEEELEAATRYRRYYPEKVWSRGIARIPALAALGMTEEVRLAVDECLTSPPRDSGEQRVIFGLAIGELRWHGHADAAAELATRAIDHFANRPAEEITSWGGRYNLAACLYLAERWDDAEALFAELAIESPGSVRCQGYLGSLAARRGERQAALKIFEELINMEDSHLYGSNLACAAGIAALLGDRARAVDLIREACGRGRWFRFPHADIDFESLRGYPAFEEWMRPKG